MYGICMHARRATLLAALMAAGVSAVPAASADGLPQMKYRTQFSPRKGGSRTAFVASFAASFKPDGMDSFYYLEAFGPPRCADASQFTDEVSVGERIRLRLRSRDIDLPHPRRRWCRGWYIANLVYQPRGLAPSVLMGNWRFRVR